MHNNYIYHVLPISKVILQSTGYRTLKRISYVSTCDVYRKFVLGCGTLYAIKPIYNTLYQSFGNLSFIKVGIYLRSGNILVLVFLVFLMLLSSYMVVNVRLLTRVHFNVMDFKTKVKVYYSSAGNFDCYWLF